MYTTDLTPNKTRLGNTVLVVGKRSSFLTSSRHVSRQILHPNSSKFVFKKIPFHFKNIPVHSISRNNKLRTLSLHLLLEQFILQVIKQRKKDQGLFKLYKKVLLHYNPANSDLIRFLTSTSATQRSENWHFLGEAKGNCFYKICHKMCHEPVRNVSSSAINGFKENWLSKLRPISIPVLKKTHLEKSKEWNKYKNLALFVTLR